MSKSAISKTGRGSDDLTVEVEEDTKKEVLLVTGKKVEAL